MHESVTADRVLRELRERRSHQALVVDEFGGTAGLLTLEDVLSELLGDVGDEFKAGDPSLETLPDGRIRLPGGMAVDDAAALLRDDVGNGRDDRGRTRHGGARPSAGARGARRRSASTSSKSSASPSAPSRRCSRGRVVPAATETEE